MFGRGDGEEHEVPKDLRTQLKILFRTSGGRNTVRFVERRGVQFAAAPRYKWGEVLDAPTLRMDVIGVGEDARRVTATRLLAVGVFAFALKKKTSAREVIVTFAGPDGEIVHMTTLEAKHEGAAKRAEMMWNQAFPASAT